MHYVYILRSISHPREIYIGQTHDLRARLAEHNAGKSHQTGKFIPWALSSYIAYFEKQNFYM